MVDIDKNIDINDVTPNCRVALRNDSYTLHKILPNKVDPLVSLMMVEKVPDSTYEMVGGLDKQIKEIKEVRKSTVSGILIAPYGTQCCGFGILIPDPNFFMPDSIVFHLGSQVRIKEFKYFNPKTLFLSSRKYYPGRSSRIRILIFLPIPDPGSRGQKGPGSGSVTLAVLLNGDFLD